MELYVDGYKLADDNKIWNKPKIFKFPSTTQVIVIHGTDTGGIGGIIGNFSNGILTDATWKCTKIWYEGWNTAEYDDSFWPIAVADATRIHLFQGFEAVEAHFDKKASWIWTSDRINDDNVYCRRNV